MLLQATLGIRRQLRLTFEQIWLTHRLLRPSFGYRSATLGSRWAIFHPVVCALGNRYAASYSMAHQSPCLFQAITHQSGCHPMKNSHMPVQPLWLPLLIGMKNFLCYIYREEGDLVLGSRLHMRNLVPKPHSNTIVSMG